MECGGGFVGFGLSLEVFEMRIMTAAIASVGGCSAAIAAVATPPRSLYSTIDLNTCTQIAKRPDGGAWRCNGLAGYPVYVAERDLHQFVSFGSNAEARRAAKQTLRASNTIFATLHGRATVEWRFDRKGDVPIPYATIVRYYTSSNNSKGEVLVVSRVTDKEACHVAYIDALASADAISLARKVADEKARRFDCASEPRVEGARGQSPI